MKESPSAGFTEIENVFIHLDDGRKLAARVWLPVDAAQGRPVPAILEYLPYRKRDGTAWRDESNYPILAAAGYAGVRADISGHGESDGEFDDEYSRRELSDGVAVIHWVAAQPWCTGSVGMMGISWGGFNALQIAALKPTPLKAIISLGSTVDRYNDDIHYKNGCQLFANFSWSSNMLCYGARAPDPALVGERWRDMWLRRLKTQPFPLGLWLRHQRRDEFWRHGSICEDYSCVGTPALVISGWGDGYSNAPPTAAANLPLTVKAINGPWIHKYPHIAWPRPRMDFHAEAIRWWDRWLKGIPNGADALPAYRAYITQGVRPGPRREYDRGRWVAETKWPSANIEQHLLYTGGGGELGDRPSAPRPLTIRSPQDCGTACGEFFSLKPDGELPGDQRWDDAGSLCFQTPPLRKDLDILGRPNMRLRVSIDRPIGNLAIRVVDVHPDGTGHRVSLGVLNLAHRAGNNTPEPMIPGQAENVVVPLDECGHRFLRGHSLRVSISTAYWPLVLPPPHIVTATIHAGEHTHLALPVRGGDDSISLAEPEQHHPPPSYIEHRPPLSKRWVERDLQECRTYYHIIEDSGDHEIAGHGMIVGERRTDCCSIRADDPRSYRLHGKYDHWMRRGAWSVRVETESRMRCDESDFFIEARVVAYEAENLVHERTWSDTIKRDMM